MRQCLASPSQHDNLLCCCRFCGEVFISTGFIRCPCCNSGNIWNIPVRDHPLFTMDWLNSHGFPFIDKVLEDEMVV